MVDEYTRLVTSGVVVCVNFTRKGVDFTVGGQTILACPVCGHSAEPGLGEHRLAESLPQVGRHNVQEACVPRVLANVEQVHAAGVGQVDGRIAADEQRRQEGRDERDALGGRIHVRIVLEHVFDLWTGEALVGARAGRLRQLSRSAKS